MSPWDFGNGLAWFGMALSAILLLVGLVSKNENSYLFVIWAVVSLFLFGFIGLIIYQTMTFGFVNGMGGIIGGVAILVGLLAFIGWLSS